MIKQPCAIISFYILKDETLKQERFLSVKLIFPRALCFGVCIGLPDVGGFLC